MINTQSFKLDIKKPTIPRLRVVNGDTANRFVITVQDDGSTVTFDTTLHKIIAVFTRADGQGYTQDADTGLSFTTGGVVTIDVRPASFRTGTNKVCLQIYKRESAADDEYPLLCTTPEAKFSARAQAIPDSGAENAPSQLPMLEQLIADAQEAIDDCEDATEAANNAADAANDAADAANTAAETLNGMLANIDDEPTQNSNNLVKSGGVYSFVNDKVQEAADDVRAQIPAGATANPLMDGTAAKGSSQKWAREDHVHPHDTTKQNVLTFDSAPTTNSNNPVKSGGIKTAIDTASKKNVYLITHDATWVGDEAQGYTHDFGDDLDAISESAVFAAQIALPDGTVATLYEYNRDDAHDYYYLKSEVVGGVYVTALLNNTTSHLVSQIIFELHEDESPLMLHVDRTEEVVTANHTYRNVVFASGDTDKLYANRNRDLCFALPTWNTTNGATVMMRLARHETDAQGTTVVEFMCVTPVIDGNDATGSVLTLAGYRVAVFYENGVFHSAVATYFTKTL